MMTSVNNILLWIIFSRVVGFTSTESCSNCNITESMAQTSGSSKLDGSLKEKFINTSSFQEGHEIDNDAPYMSQTIDPALDSSQSKVQTAELFVVTNSSQPGQLKDIVGEAHNTSSSFAPILSSSQIEEHITAKSVTAKNTSQLENKRDTDDEPYTSQTFDPTLDSSSLKEQITAKSTIVFNGSQLVNPKSTADEAGHPMKHFVPEPLIIVPPQNNAPDSRIFTMFKNQESGEVSFSVSYPIWMGHYQILCDFGYSCHGSCGKKVSFLTPLGRKCSCDKMCRYFGDCCQDYFFQCESLKTDEEVETFLRHRLPFSEENKNLESDVYSDLILAEYGTCEYMNVYVGDDHFLSQISILIVSKCPNTFMDTSGFDLQGACENGPQRKLFSLPVSYRWNAQLVYKNIYCAFCHGLEIRDISFWEVQVHCDSLAPQMTWSIDELLGLVEIDGICSSSIAPTVSNFDHYRSCDRLHAFRCSNDKDDGFSQFSLQPESKRSLDEVLCNSYLRPFEFNNTLYANIHCLACLDRDKALQESFALKMCYLIVASGQAFFPTNNLAMVSFRNGIFSIYTQSKMTGKKNEVYDSVRHENCPHNDGDPTQNFFDTCRKLPSCDHAKPPGEVLTSQELECSVRKHRYNGTYNRQELDLEDYFINITFTLSLRHDAEHLRILSSWFHEVLTGAESDDLDSTSTYELQDIVFLKSNESIKMDVLIHWTTQEKLVNVLHQAAIIDMKVRKALDTYYNSSKYADAADHKVNSFAVANFRPNTLPCRSLNVKEFKKVNVVTFDFLTLIFIKKSICFLDLDQLPFITGYNGDRVVPISIDNVFMCQNDDIESICGTVFSTDSDNAQGSKFSRYPQKGIGDPNNISLPTTPNDSTNQIDTVIDGNDDQFYKDLQTFRNICFSICLFGQLLKIVNVFRDFFAGNNKLKLRSAFKGNCFASDIVLIFLIFLLLISKEIHGLDDFVMGILSHICWLALAGVTFISSWNLKNEVGCNLFKGVSQGVLMLVAIDVTVCSIIEQDGDIDITIGYSHKTKHLFWISNEIVCSIALVSVCSFLFLLSFLSVFFCDQKFNSDDNVEAEENNSRNLPQRRKVYAKLIPDTFFMVLFLLAIIDFYQDQNYFWPLLFDLVIFCFGAFQILVFVVSYQDYTKKQETSTNYVC